MHTLQVFNIGINNQENVDPNWGNCALCMTLERWQQSQPLPYHFPSKAYTPPQNNAFGAIQNNNSFAQGLRQMKGTQDEVD